MWSQFRALAARIGLGSDDVAAVERQKGASLVQSPRDPLVQLRVRPDPDWTQRMGEAWNQTMANSRREEAGSIELAEGLLAILDAHSPQNGVNVGVAPGRYEVVLTVAHLGSEKTYDYEEHVSHAFLLLAGQGNVAMIEPVTDEHGAELWVQAHAIAFAAPGKAERFAGAHSGNWSRELADVFGLQESCASGHAARLCAPDGDASATCAIVVHAGHGRDEYPVFRLADSEGNAVGAMMDFFVDNRPCE